MNHEKLKPCPFCGNQIAPRIILLSDANYTDEGDSSWEFDSTHYIGVCAFNVGGCGACSSRRNDTPEEAAEAWNRRTNDV